MQETSDTRSIFVLAQRGNCLFETDLMPLMQNSIFINSKFCCVYPTRKAVAEMRQTDRTHH